ncbi:unnamed protein product [Mytilus edulis]|uniref:C2H2-type domain-containing protein n=1 Tax=Mytilus edulis TaxID=6550 RepID=A0A8S3V0A3_MYTED|nr:unnamed protein product [Mytilus edulis]
MLTKAEPVVRRQKNSGSSDSESKRTEKVKLESRDIKQEHVIEISSDSDVDTDSLMFEPTQRVVKEESTDENDMMFEPSQKLKVVKRNLISVNLPQLNIINDCLIPVDFHSLGRPNPKVETAVDPVLSGIFTCETDGCVQSFNTHRELEEHHLVDKCVITAEKHSKFHKVQLYVEKLNTAQITQRDVELAPANVIEGQNRQAMGWALKASRLNKRFSEKQKKYLIAKFNIGLQTGNKEDPDSVAEEMKYATQNGSRIFLAQNF